MNINYLLSLVLLMVFSSSLIAQDSPTDKGVILIKGGSNLNLTFSDGTPIDLNVGGAYFVTKNIPVGVDLSYFSFDGESDINIEPFARYYMKEKYFAGARLIKSFNDEGDDVYGLGLEGGYVFYLNDYVAVEPTIHFPLVDNADLRLQVSFSIYY